ncbi:MAG TPA: hypothetical protein PKM37_06495 [Ornithinibacter sp.]|nr:hypothetical protein [Ornithinibacter sp.]
MARDVIRHLCLVEPAPDPHEQLALTLARTLALCVDLLTDDLDDRRIELVQPLANGSTVAVDEEFRPFADATHLPVQGGS